jgi:uncharacterized protein (TIRG00374 family)
MKKFFLFFISLLIGLGLFCWIASHIGWGEIKSAFRQFSVQAGLLILFLTILSALVRSLRWKTILNSQELNIPFLKVFEYYLSGLSVNFFFPMVIFGGEIFRGYDLKEKYSFPWSKSIASVLIDRILEITIYTLTAILGIIFFIIKIPHLAAKIFLAIFLGTLLFLVLISFFYFKIFKKESIILALMRKLNLKNSNGTDTMVEVEKEIFRYFRPKREAMWEGFALSLLHEIILLGRTGLLILFLGKEISVLSAISIVAFSSLAMLIPIPADLGFHDAVQSFIFESLGLGANTGMAFVFIIRIVELIVALLGAVFFFRFGIQVLASLIFKKITKLIKHGKNESWN